jgi:hypothetical protein
MIDLLNNDSLKDTLSQLKKSSESLRPTLRKQILAEKVNLDTYKSWLNTHLIGEDNGIYVPGVVKQELQKLDTDPDYAVEAVQNLLKVWLSKPENIDWLDKAVEQRVANLMIKKDGLTK